MINTCISCTDPSIPLAADLLGRQPITAQSREVKSNGQSVPLPAKRGRLEAACANDGDQAAHSNMKDSTADAQPAKRKRAAEQHTAKPAAGGAIAAAIHPVGWLQTSPFWSSLEIFACAEVWLLIHAVAPAPLLWQQLICSTHIQQTTSASLIQSNRYAAQSAVTLHCLQGQGRHQHPDAQRQPNVQSLPADLNIVSKRAV